MIRYAPLAGLIAGIGTCSGAPFFDGVDEASRPVMAEARKRIEQVRKGDFSIRLSGPDDQPVEKPVSFRLASHHFPFGTNLFGFEKLADDDPAKLAAERVIDELFNLVIVCNYWGATQKRQDGPSDFGPTDYQLKWARDHNKAVRFHALIYSPPWWIKTLESRQEGWRIIEERIRTFADRYADVVLELDVINEMVGWRIWKDKREFFDRAPNFPRLWLPENGARVVRLARRYFPDTKLVVLETGSAVVHEANAQFREICDYHRRLGELEAPYDYVGFQAHFYATGNMPFEQGMPPHRGGPGAFTMAKLSEGLDHLASLGKPIVITEFNPPSRNRKRRHQPDQPRLSDEEIAAWQVNYYTLVFSKPYVKAMSRWFTVDELGGRGMDAGLVTKDGQLKPAYYALRKLFKEDWNTDCIGVPANGTATFRGFYGTYDVTADGYKPATITLEPGTRSATVQFRPADG